MTCDDLVAPTRQVPNGLGKSFILVFLEMRSAIDLLNDRMHQVFSPRSSILDNHSKAKEYDSDEPPPHVGIHQGITWLCPILSL